MRPKYYVHTGRESHPLLRSTQGETEARRPPHRQPTPRILKEGVAGVREHSAVPSNPSGAPRASEPPNIQEQRTPGLQTACVPRASPAVCSPTVCRHLGFQGQMVGSWPGGALREEGSAACLDPEPKVLPRRWGLFGGLLVLKGSSLTVPWTRPNRHPPQVGSAAGGQGGASLQVLQPVASTPNSCTGPGSWATGEPRGVTLGTRGALAQANLRSGKFT